MPPGPQVKSKTPKSLVEKLARLLDRNFFLTKKEKDDLKLKLKTFDSIELNGLLAIFEQNNNQLKSALEHHFKKDPALLSKLKAFENKETKRIGQKIHSTESAQAEQDLGKKLNALNPKRSI